MIRLFSACACCERYSIPASAQNCLESAVSINVSLSKEEIYIASQYDLGDGYRGRRTASGEFFNTHALTAAHRARRFGSHVTVKNKANRRSAKGRITDRRPFIKARFIDPSQAAANAIGMGGTARAKPAPIEKRPTAQFNFRVIQMHEDSPAEDV